MSATSPSRAIRVGFLGFGTVGTGAYRMLKDNSEAITRKIGRPIEVAVIGIKDADKPRMLPPGQFTTDLESIVEDPSIEVILELMGGTDPAGRLVEQALQNGKHVVTANKELIAKHGARLLKLAHARGLDLHYEAAVGGGIPLVQPLKHQLAGNDVLKMMGILNGTTNYILTKMADEGAEFEVVLKEAQAKGYAEADPSADVDGYDAAYKIAILASIAFGKQVPIEGVYREGIRNVTNTDISYAGILGYKIKLLGIVEPVSNDRIMVRVHPTMIPKDHPLASVNDVYNAVWIHGDFAGDLMFSGRGAGSDPTASAVVGDLIDVGRSIARGAQGSTIVYEPGMQTESIDSLCTAYYVRLLVLDKPKVLGSIATAFGEHEVGLAAMEMRVVDSEQNLGEIAFLTHPCIEGDFRRALQDIENSGIVKRVASWIRVERGT
ncbi:MAG: homoserine dehydrogenase [Fimbriimonadales bacterium]